MYPLDAYERVKDGVAYPAVMCVTGLNDPRVPTWMVAKMAARLQAASASGKPILLRADFDAGHGRLLTPSMLRLEPLHRLAGAVIVLDFGNGFA
jgi:protease II